VKPSKCSILQEGVDHDERPILGLPSLTMTIETYDKDAVKAAAKALVSAVESFDGDASSVESRCQPMLNMFSGETDLLVHGLTPKKQESFFLDLLRSQSKGFMRRFFVGLHAIVEVIALEEAYVPESAFEHDADDTRDAATKAANDKRAKTCLSFLKYTALCTYASLERQLELKKGKEGSAQVQMEPEVHNVALQLHNMLLSIHDCGEEALSTRNAILSLCESWWLSNASNRDSLIAQVLPLLVLQASDPVTFQKSHIIKLLSFKDAFQVIDFLNPASDSLRTLLLKVASNPLCLRLPEGRKFLASLFRDPDLISDLHLAFRAQIPQASKTILQAYGEIYFKAWCDAEDVAEDETKETLEHQALQDLMHCAIHIGTPTMAKSILTVLSPIHMEKRTKRVADLLYRLYSPILWRSLSATNPRVRKNSIAVLDQVFPLHDPSQSQMKAAIEKCIQAIKKGLQDVDPKVRIAASQAAANTCALFWDVLPSSDIRMLLNRKCQRHPGRPLCSTAVSDTIFCFRRRCT
jgi:Condensin II non structural maintenance of chromosomes subunit